MNRIFEQDCRQTAEDTNDETEHDHKLGVFDMLVFPGYKLKNHSRNSQVQCIYRITNVADCFNCYHIPDCHEMKIQVSESAAPGLISILAEI